MRKRTAALIVLGAITPGVAGVALATPPTPDGALKSELLARGAAGEFRIHDESMGLRMEARQKTDVAVVRATLEPGGSTGWHGHRARRWSSSRPGRSRCAKRPTASAGSSTESVAADGAGARRRPSLREARSCTRNTSTSS